MLRDPCAVRDHVSSPSADARSFFIVSFLPSLSFSTVLLGSGFRLRSHWPRGWSGMSYRFDLPALHFSLSLIRAFVFHETRDIPSSLCSRWNHFSVIRTNIRSSPTSVEISFDFFLLFVPSRPSPFSRRVCSFCISYSPVFFVSFEASSER